MKLIYEKSVEGRIGYSPLEDEFEGLLMSLFLIMQLMKKKRNSQRFLK